MNSFVTFTYLLMGLVCLLITFAAGMVALDWWKEHRRKGSKEIVVSRARGRSLLKTEWGWLTISKYRRYSETEYHLTLLDYNRIKYNKIVHAEELEPMNVMQALCGPGPAMFVLRPGDRTERLASQDAKRDMNAALLHAYKTDAERKNAEAKIAQTKIKQNVREIVEHVNQGVKARQPPQHK
jgi:hypothetical protein